MIKSIIHSVSVWWYRLWHPRWWWKQFGSRSANKIAQVRRVKFKRNLKMAVSKKHYKKILKHLHNEKVL